MKISLADILSILTEDHSQEAMASDEAQSKSRQEKIDRAATEKFRKMLDDFIKEEIEK